MSIIVGVLWMIGVCLKVAACCHELLACCHQLLACRGHVVTSRWRVVKVVPVSKQIMFEMLCAVDVLIFMQFSLLESHICLLLRRVFLVWMCHGHHGHCASEGVGGQFSFFLVWFADCTFLKTLCADQFSLVFPASDVDVSV